MNNRRRQENFILCPPGRCPWILPPPPPPLPPPPQRPHWGGNDWGCPNCGANQWRRDRYDGYWNDDRYRRDYYDRRY